MVFLIIVKRSAMSTIERLYAPDTVEKLDLCAFCGLTGYFLGHVYVVKSLMFITGSSGRKGSKWGLLHGTGVFQHNPPGADPRSGHQVLEPIVGFPTASCCVRKIT